MKKTLYILTALGFIFFNAAAQRPPAISSPDINPDHSITFRYYSRTAQKVMLRGEFLTSPSGYVKRYIRYLECNCAACKTRYLSLQF